MLEAEAAINVNLSSTIGISPFFTTNKYKPYISFDLQESIALLTKDLRDARERTRTKKIAKAI